MQHHRGIFACAALTLSLSVANVAEARSFRVADLPNGSRYGCRSCHNGDTGATRTNFGSDAPAHREPGLVPQAHIDWAGLCPLDSDGDGWHNGYELGDPDCVWTRGSPDPGGQTTNPGQKGSHPPPICNSGKLEGGEDCDGALLSLTDCAELGYGTGQLACNANCSFDYSGCSNPPPVLPGPADGDESGDDSAGCALTPGAHASARRTSGTTRGGSDQPLALLALVGAMAAWLRRRRVRSR